MWAGVLLECSQGQVFGGFHLSDIFNGGRIVWEVVFISVFVLIVAGISDGERATEFKGPMMALPGCLLTIVTGYVVQDLAASMLRAYVGLNQTFHVAALCILFLAFFAMLGLFITYIRDSFDRAPRDHRGHRV